MRIIKTSFLLLFIFIVSCNSDDNSTDSVQDNPVDILGTWNLSEYSSTSTTAESGKITTEEGINIDYVIEFIDNPKEIVVSGSIEYSVEETTGNNTNSFTAIINGDFGEGFHTGEWRIENNNLITRSFEVDPNEAGAFDLITEIVELTDTSLILRINNAQYSSDNSTFSGNTTLRYIR